MFDTMGCRLKRLREEKGLSQGKMADDIGFARSYVSHLENDQKEPSISTCSRLADYYGVTMDYLYKGRDVSDDPTILELLSKWSQLTEQEKKSYLFIIGKR